MLILNFFFWSGVFHGDDLKYFLKNAYEPLDFPEGHRECVTRDRMTAIFVAFARTGDPNCEATEKERWEPIRSPVIDSNTAEPFYQVFDISDELRMIRLPEWERMRFWDCLYRMIGCPLY